MMEWLRDIVMLLRSTILRYFLSRKKHESVIFVKEEFSAVEVPEKRRCFQKFDHKLSEEAIWSIAWNRVK